MRFKEDKMRIYETIARLVVMYVHAQLKRKRFFGNIGENDVKNLEDEEDLE